MSRKSFWSTRIMVDVIGCAIFLAAFFMSGCLESKNPIADPHREVIDNRLVGIWYWHTDHENSKYKVEPFKNGVGKVLKENDDGVFEFFGDVHVSIVNGESYLNLYNKEYDSYMLFNYKFSDDKILVVFHAGEKSTKNALKSHGGKISYDASYAITDSSRNVEKFIASANTHELFGTGIVMCKSDRGEIFQKAQALQKELSGLALISANKPNDYYEKT